MKIALVIPSQTRIYGKLHPPVQMHMGIAYIAASVEKGNSVRIIDIDGEGLTPDGFVEVLREEQFALIGFTATTPTYHESVRFARLAKQTLPETCIVFGGYHPTLQPEEVIREQSVDIVAVGEGEKTLQEIVHALEDGVDFSLIQGILYKKNEDIIQTPPRLSFQEDLDQLPFPARHLYPIRMNTYPDALHANAAIMITSRGCPGKCTYCTSPKMFQQKCRFRSAHNVVDEMEFLIKQHGVKEIHIWDDNFVTWKKRVFEICNQMVERKLHVHLAFPNGIRANCLDRDILQCLKKMGTYSLALGVESGNQNILDAVKKGMTLEKIEEVFHLCRQLKIEVWAFFMIGLPGETAETIQQTIDFAKKLNPDVAKFHILKPYPESEVYTYLEEHNFLCLESYEDLGIHTPPVHRLAQLTPEAMLKWQKIAYRAFYFTPSQIIRQILRVKSWNRLKLNVKVGIDLLKMAWGNE